MYVPEYTKIVWLAAGFIVPDRALEVAKFDQSLKGLANVPVPFEAAATLTNHIGAETVIVAVAVEVRALPVVTV